MLLLSDASSIVFLKFLQIFLWISIPALLIGMLITTVIHYSNKRKKRKSEEQPFIFENDDSCAGYDDVSLMPMHLQRNDQETKKIMNYLSFSTARYIAMQKDFKFLTEKYQQLQANKSYINQNLETKNNDTMETIHTDLQQIPGQQIDLIRQQQHEIEKR